MRKDYGNVFLIEIKHYFNNPIENVLVLSVNISIKIRLVAFYWGMVCNGAVQNVGGVLRTPPILNCAIAYHTPIKCNKSNFNP